MLLLGGLVCGGLLAGAARAQSPSGDEFYLSPATRRTLSLFQQYWADWLAAFEAKDREVAETAVESLLDGARLVGMERIPELAVGAAMRAVQAASEGDSEWARYGLRVAERLDPGRPETSFAASRVALLSGHPWQAVVSSVEGVARAWRQPLERALILNDSVLWLLLGLLLTGAAFVAVVMAVRGQRLLEGFARVSERYFSRSLGYFLGTAFLLWPLLLPAGWFWLGLFWSVVLWAYASRTERAVFVALWLLVGAAPVLVNELRRRVAVEMSSMVRAVEDARTGRLQGDLFNELGKLSGVLPDSVAVRQVLADQHRRLGQCEYARSLFLRILEEEPTNEGALIDLGICHFLRGELEQAIEYFQKGVQVDAESAAGYYDLSVAYSALYRFDDHEQALARAQELDRDKVLQWLQSESGRGVAPVESGMARVEEIKQELLRSWALESENVVWATPWRDFVTLLLPVVCLVASLLFSWAAPRSSAAGGERVLRLPGKLDAVRRLLIPGLPEAEAGEWGWALLALWIPLTLLVLPWIGRLAYPLTWGFDSGVDPLPWLAGGGLVLFLLLRARRQLGR